MIQEQQACGPQPVPMQASTLGSTMAKAFLATAILCAIAVGGVARGSLPWLNLRHADDITPAQQQQRQQQFAALPALQLVPVDAAELKAAVDGMHLAPASKAVLLADAGGVPAASASAVALPQRQPAPALRLAWISLWDTDAEDGDVVRIESQGYVRSFTLTRQAVTVAIPMPANGLIRVSGVRDGEGGGITVGLASGSVKAIFPVMSVGQVLNLKVKIN